MRKLLKYELRAMNRSLFPIYGGLLAVALVNCLFNFSGPLDEAPFVRIETFALYDMLQFLTIMLYIGLIVGMGVVWLMTTINRFHKGLLGEEGYLMFTLPVSTGKLMSAKLLGASIHLFLAGLTALLSTIFLIGLPVLRAEIFLELERAFQILTRDHPTWLLLVFEALLLLLFSAFKTILQFYLAMAIGHLSTNHRMLCSVGAYIGITTALSFLAMLFVSGLSVLEPPGFVENIIHTLMDNAQLSAHVSLLATLFITALQCALFWFPTRYILHRRLNLE